MIYFTFILFCEWSKQLYRPSFSTRPDLHSGFEVSTYHVPLCYLPSLQLHLPATSTIVSHPLVSPTPVATVYLHLEIPPWFDSKCRWKKKKKIEDWQKGPRERSEGGRDYGHFLKTHMWARVGTRETRDGMWEDTSMRQNTRLFNISMSNFFTLPWSLPHFICSYSTVRALYFIPLYVRLSCCLPLYCCQSALFSTSRSASLLYMLVLTFMYWVHNRSIVEWARRYKEHKRQDMERIHGRVLTFILWEWSCNIKKKTFLFIHQLKNWGKHICLFLVF